MPESGQTIFYDSTVSVFGAPMRYIQGEGAIERIGVLASSLGSRAVLVADATILAMYGEKILQYLALSGVNTVVLECSGDLLQTTANDLLQGFQRQSGDVVIACGGGRAIDTGKAVAEILQGPLMTVPTAASNDAPTSKNFVLYDQDHRLVEVRNLSRNPDYVLVDTSIISQAPAEYFSAGIGDAIAKLVEAMACSKAGGVNMFRSRPPRVALAIAAACENILLSQGCDAFDVAGTGQVTEDFDACVEAVILMAGLAFENGGLSIAHALTRGLPLIPEIRNAHHGAQVAYGVLVQKTFEGSLVDPRLIKLMKRANLPLSLAELAGRPVKWADFEVIAQGTIGVPHLKNSPKDVSVEGLVQAMSVLEEKYQ